MDNVFVTLMIFSLSIISGISEGADWTLITKGDADVFIDRESIEHISDKVDRVWVKYRYSMPKKFDYKYIKELAVYREYNCGEGKFKILRTIGYFTDGTSETDTSERQGYVLRDDVAYKYLCKH